MANQSIKCKVTACSYHSMGNECTLDSIEVSEQKSHASEKHDTLCASFEAK